MSEVTVIGVDLTKQVFRLHGAGSDGSVVFGKKPSLGQVPAFFARHAKCDVATKTCATAHGWMRRFGMKGLKH